MRAWARGNPGKRAKAATHKTHDGDQYSQGGGLPRASDAEAHILGVDPSTWARVQTFWEGTHDRNEKATLEGYERGMLNKLDLKSLKEGGQLTGDIASEIARRVTDSAPHVAFLDNAFLTKVTPPEGGGTRFRSQY